jgi:AraC-like DNA-binding protein
MTLSSLVHAVSPAVVSAANQNRAPDDVDSFGMSEQTLYSGKDVALKEYRCSGGGDGAVEATANLELVFVRRGCFVVTSPKGEVAVTPNEVLLLAPGRKYSVRHPFKGGDDCTVISVLTDEVALSHDAHASLASLTAVVFSAQIELLAEVRGNRSLAVEERIWSITRSTVSDFGGSKDRREAPRRAVATAREFIAAHFSESLPLWAIADVAGLSSYHLCRVFRSFTGMSIHQYQTRLRLREAMVRLAGGESDIARLAFDLGFSSHSHFTTSFRREFGFIPASFRRRASPRPAHSGSH